MSVADGKTVSIEYTLTHEGNVLDSNVGGEPLSYAHGANEIVPGLERELLGMTAGQTKEVIVEAADGYGEMNEQAVVEVPKERVPTEAHVEGAQLMTQDPDGNVLQPIVTEVKDSTVMLDFNHPLAGKTLTFNIKVLEIQD